MEDFQSPMTDRQAVTSGGTSDIPVEVNFGALTSELQSLAQKDEEVIKPNVQQVGGGEFLSLGTPPVKDSQYLTVVSREQKVSDTFGSYAEELILRKKRGKKESE